MTATSPLVISYPDGRVAYIFQRASCDPINWASAYTYRPDGSLHTA